MLKKTVETETALPREKQTITKMLTVIKMLDVFKK